MSSVKKRNPWSGGVPKPPKVNKNVEKFQALGKERYFGSQKLLRGRVVASDIVAKPGISELVAKMLVQGWAHLFVCLLPMVYEIEVVEFYVNFEELDGVSISTSVLGIPIVLDAAHLGQLLPDSLAGFEDYDMKKDRESLRNSLRIESSMWLIGCSRER